MYIIYNYSAFTQTLRLVTNRYYSIVVHQSLDAIELWDSWAVHDGKSYYGESMWAADKK